MKDVKYIFSLTIIFVIYYTSISQPKYDYNWTLGLPYYEPVGNTQGGILLNFNQNPVELSFFENQVQFYTTSVISDASGNLMAYSSGCNIFNSANELVAGSEDINEGFTHDWNCVDNGYPLWQGCMFLPFPGHDSSYILVHIFQQEFQNEPTKVLYSILDINATFPAGNVATKNILAGEGRFADQLSAVQHANGRDWWVVVPYMEFNSDSNSYYIFLADPDGVKFSHRQDIGDNWSSHFRPGQTCFSPDGNYYARADPQNGLIVFDFDRCEGLLSNPRRAAIYDDAELGVAGVAFSPSSRFLYANTVKNLYQHDMTSTDFEASQVLVAKYDTFFYNDLIPTNFFQEALAPNEKIYIGVSSTVPFLHIIHWPNMKAPFCHFEQRGLELPVSNSPTLPNMPHFRTGPIDGSNCDTLGINGPEIVPPDTTETPDCIGQGLKVGPNPVADFLYITNYSCGQISVYNVLGQLIREFNPEQDIEWDVRLIPSGVYFLVLHKGSEVLKVERVAVEK